MISYFFDCFKGTFDYTESVYFLSYLEMRISIGFSGPAGAGINTAGLLLGKLLSYKGYTILADKEYASTIKGDNNNFFLYISDSEYFISKKIDYFFAFDDFAVSKNEKIYNLKKVYNVKKSDTVYKNIFCFGAILKLLGIPLDEAREFINQNFTGEALSINLVCLTQGYDYIKKPSSLSLDASIGTPKEFMFGNEIIGIGALESGMNFYAAYPMTPASSLIEVIASDKRAIFFQGEDEIAVSMAMLGAKFAGKRSMCGTSGGGFCLMTESIGFSNQAEIGGVYILGQRDGPSTGTPTFTAQGDLNYALHASFGDTLPIVITPASYQDGYNFIGKALNRSDIYQHPVIVLLDKQFCECYLTLDKNTLKAEAINRGKIVSSGQLTVNSDYKRYEYTTDGISPVTLPGTENAEFIATSYEHDEHGATNEDPTIKKSMVEKRFKKMETFVQKEFNEHFYGYEIINPEAKYFFVTFGFTTYTIQDYIRSKNKKSKKYGVIVIKTFQPFDKRLKAFLDEHAKQIKKLIFVEMNYTGQMQELVTNICLLNDKKRIKKISNLRKYNLYPVFLEDLKRL